MPSMPEKRPASPRPGGDDGEPSSEREHDLLAMGDTKLLTPL
jgi:hypothetical protein